jgi:hypothetical protein
MSTEQKSTQIASHRVRAGKRTYFFDIKAGPKGGLYLALSETAAQEEGVFTRSRMLVFDSHIREFYEGLCEAIRSLRDEQRKCGTEEPGPAAQAEEASASPSPSRAKPAARKSKAA